MEKFKLEHQYQLYLQRSRLNESAMHPQQKIETKRAFMGACGQLLIMFRDEIGAIENESEAIDTLEDLIKQVGGFWITQINGN